jgi:hypothetical protein
MSIARPISRAARLAALALRQLTLITVFSAAAAAAGDEIAHASEPPSSGPVALVLSALPADMDAERLRAAIQLELGVSVAIAPSLPESRSALVLRIEDRRRAALTYRAEDGRVTARSIELPGSADEAIETVALLAGNLVRDEAAELAAALKTKPGEEAPAAPPEPAPAQVIVVLPAASAPPQPAAESDDPAAAKRSPCALGGAPYVFAGADLVPFFGTGVLSGAPQPHVRSLSANLLAGYTAGIQGVEVSVGVSVTSFVCGAQLAAAANIDRGPVRGVQVASAVNFGRSLAGVQASGGVNIADTVRGVQLSSINIARSDVEGMQAGMLNITAGSVLGAQASLLNIATRSVLGAQVGLLNFAAGPTSGAQLGLLNIAGDEVKGVQVGLVNIASQSSFSLGLLNIIHNGRFHLDAWGTDSGLMMLGVKHGGAHFHNIYGAGVRPVGDKFHAAFAFGIGGHIPLSDAVFVDPDAIGYSLLPPSDVRATSSLFQARVLVGASLAKRFAIYAGPTFNALLNTDAESTSLTPLPAYTFNKGESGYTLRALWPGVTLGIQAL